MKLSAILFTALVVLAAAQAVAMALYLAILAGLVIGLFAAPRETIGLVGLLIVAGIVQRYPLPSMALFALAVVAKAMGRR